MKKNHSDEENNKKNRQKSEFNKSEFGDEITNFYKNKNIIKKIKNQRKKKNKKIILITEIVAIALLLFLAFGIFFFIGRFGKKDYTLDDIGITAEDDAAEKRINDITNFLVLGIDDNNVSDCIMICSLDKLNKKIKLISVMRDSLMKIEPANSPAYFSKINEAYSNGREKTTLRAINKNLGLKISDYVKVNFTGLVNVIDQLGGITIKISPAERYAIDGIINTTKSLKKIHSDMLSQTKSNSIDEINLNGSQAVAYSRIRKTATIDGKIDDGGRTARQRLVMMALLEKILSIEKSKIPSLAMKLLPNVSTSFDLKKLLDIYACVKGKNFTIAHTRVPLPEYTIDPDYNYHGKSTVFYDLNYAGQAVNKLLYENIDQESFIKNNPPNVKKIDSHKAQNSFKNHNIQNNQNKKNKNASSNSEESHNNRNSKNSTLNSNKSNDNKKAKKRH